VNLIVSPNKRYKCINLEEILIYSYHHAVVLVIKMVFKQPQHDRVDLMDFGGRELHSIDTDLVSIQAQYDYIDSVLRDLPKFMIRRNLVELALRKDNIEHRENMGEDMSEDLYAKRISFHANRIGKMRINSSYEAGFTSAVFPRNMESPHVEPMNFYNVFKKMDEESGNSFKKGIKLADAVTGYGSAQLLE
jgi:hypothetical protein